MLILVKSPINVRLAAGAVVDIDPAQAALHIANGAATPVAEGKKKTGKSRKEAVINPAFDALFDEPKIKER